MVAIRGVSVLLPPVAGMSLGRWGWWHLHIWVLMQSFISEEAKGEIGKCYAAEDEGKGEDL